MLMNNLSCIQLIGEKAIQDQATYIYHLKMKKDTWVPLQTLDLRSMIPDSPITLMSRLIKNTFSSLPADGPPRHLTVKKTSNK